MSIWRTQSPRTHGPTRLDKCANSATVSDRYVWLALFLLGCYHGLNPGMGWLFAVALGLQERSTGALVRAVVPIALGHVASVTVIVSLAAFAALSLPRAVVHDGAAAILLSFAAYRLVRSRHPRWVGMRVGFWGLTLWGFLMSSAHGAGLMLVPFVTASPAFAQPAMPMPMPMPSVHPISAQWLMGLLMVSIHTLGYVLTMTAIALVVYAKFGVSFLRQAWFNVDLVWAAALIVAGLVALLT
jgi:hypothetical protein